MTKLTKSPGGNAGSNAGMAQHMLSLPFRRTTSVELADAIKGYISGKYDQHPDMFRDDLRIIEDLRMEAVHVREPHPSGVQKIAAYAGQLTWLGGKFPVDIGVDFTWYPALGYNTDRPVVEDNLRFELANVLFNLAALYSQLALFSNRGTPEGLKAACNYLSAAAGVVKHVRVSVLPDMRCAPPEDMDEAALESLESLFLAQCQECFWQKAVIDNYKDASIAKLAAKVSDFYAQAGDWAVRTNAISSDWIHHMSAKHHHFAAGAQLRQAMHCLEKHKYGEEVARLRDSLACVTEGLKEQRYIGKVIVQDLTSLKDKVTEDLKRAERDNDMIYLNPVPAKAELRILERATMATVRIPKEVSDPTSFIGDRGEFGPPLFSKLVPYSVHVAATIYEERRDRLVNVNIIDELELMTTKIHDVLSSLNLPGSLQALEKPLGLPQTLLAHAEEVRQADAITRLHRSFADSVSLKQADEKVFLEGQHILGEEAAEDDRLRAKHGTDRWRRPTSAQAGANLYSQANELRGYLDSAAASDALVAEKFHECEPMLRIFQGSDRELGNFVPSSRRVEIPPKVEDQATQLRDRLNELSRFEGRRRRKIEALREAARKDDISSSILTEAARLERESPSQILVPAHFEDFFERRLARYSGDIEGVKREGEEQERLLQALKSTNGAFVAAKTGFTSSRDREQALQKLENAFFKYKEIVNNLEIGRKFYNDLAKLVAAFRDRCNAFNHERREEARQLEGELNLPPLGKMSLRQPQGSSPPRHNPEQRALSPRALHEAIPHSVYSNRTMPAPVPTRPPAQGPPILPVSATWDPDMGIKFGGLPPQQPMTGDHTGAAQITVLQDHKWVPQNGVRFG